jgi:hypothetical protein
MREQVCGPNPSVSPTAALTPAPVAEERGLPTPGQEMGVPTSLPNSGPCLRDFLNPATVTCPVTLRACGGCHKRVKAPSSSRMLLCLGLHDSLISGDLK